MNPWTALLDLLGRILAFSYDLVPSFGVAIIFLTLLVSVILFPLTLKQTRSMRAMQEIQPEVKRLQKELKGDREELNKQLMALYQERGINPAAGCLPLILQMPIWFALFRVLNINVEKPSGHIPTDSGLWASLVEGKQSFLAMDLLRSPSGSITDGFVAALPYLILIAFVVATSYYQQYQTTKRRSPLPDDPKQQQQQQTMQTVMKVMPVFFGFISWTLPAGLVLYFAVSGLFRIGQQAVIIRLDDEHAAEAAAAERSGKSSGPSTGEEPEPPKSSGPSPHASKKRKKRRRK